MSVDEKPTSQDSVIERAFGTPLDQLYSDAARGEGPPAAQRVMELRSILALAEEQVSSVRDRIHRATLPARESQLTADELRFDVQWLDAALSARHKYLAALGEVLRAMPAPGERPPQRTQFTQPQISARSTPASGSPPGPSQQAPSRRP